jgi:hypothetical protein
MEWERAVVSSEKVSFELAYKFGCKGKVSGVPMNVKGCVGDIIHYSRSRVTALAFGAKDLPTRLQLCNFHPSSYFYKQYNTCFPSNTDPVRITNTQLTSA